MQLQCTPLHPLQLVPANTWRINEFDGLSIITKFTPTSVIYTSEHKSLKHQGHALLLIMNGLILSYPLALLHKATVIRSLNCLVPLQGPCDKDLLGGIL